MIDPGFKDTRRKLNVFFDRDRVIINDKVTHRPNDVSPSEWLAFWEMAFRY